MRAFAGVLLIGAVIIAGVLAWTSVGELLRSAQDAGSSLRQIGGAVAVSAPSPAATPAPTAPTPLPVSAARSEDRRTGQAAIATPPATGTPVVTATGEASADASATPSPATLATPTPSGPSPTPAGRNPWVLLPAPAPGSRIPSGPAVIEARGRGDAPIREIHLELDGSAVPAALEQRSESIWRAHASVALSPGQHQARAVVVDTEGRTGAYRWSFEASR